MSQLFDALVGSILNHSSEIWEFNKYKEIERIYNKFGKHIQRVQKTTCSVTIYGN